MLENFLLRGDPVLGMTHGLPVRFWVHPPQPTGRRSQAFLGLPKPTKMHSKLTTASAQRQGLRTSDLTEQPALALHKSDPGQPRTKPWAAKRAAGPGEKACRPALRVLWKPQASAPLPRSAEQREVWVQECPTGPLLGASGQAGSRVPRDCAPSSTLEILKELGLPA